MIIKEHNSQQEQQIPQHENQLREIDQLLQQKEIKIQQTEQQRQEQVNQLYLQESLREVRREIQQQISRNSVLIEQQAQPGRVTIRDITQWLSNIIYKGIPKENVPQRVAKHILKDNMNLESIPKYRKNKNNWWSTETANEQRDGIRTVVIG